MKYDCPPLFVPYGNLCNNLVIIAAVTYFGVRREGVARPEYTKISSTFLLDCYMINNSSLQTFYRLAQKNLDTQFHNELITGLCCSPFEADAIIKLMSGIYSPFLSSNGSLLPGQILMTVLSVDNSPARSLAESKLVTVTLTLDKPEEDLPIRENYGVPALRQHRIIRVCNEALMQDGILTAEDLAYRLFNCGMRTISRDLAAIRAKELFVPLRSTVHDMGRTLSHRSLIIKLWLRGKEYSDISRDAFHSVKSVQNYVDKFKRVIALSLEGFDTHTIAFLVRLSAPLVEEYRKLFNDKQMPQHRILELESFLKKNSFSEDRYTGGSLD